MDKISRFLACCGGLFTTDLQLYGLQNMTWFTLLSDAELDQLVLNYLNRHGLTTGGTYLAGFLKSIGLIMRVQRRRVRERLTRVDPANAVLKWGIVITRRQYSVP